MWQGVQHISLTQIGPHIPKRCNVEKIPDKACHVAPTLTEVLTYINL